MPNFRLISFCIQPFSEEKLLDGLVELISKSIDTYISMNEGNRWGPVNSDKQLIRISHNKRMIYGSLWLDSSRIQFLFRLAGNNFDKYPCDWFI